MPKHLVIVESPTKAKTIKRFLGKDYSVHASMGHVRDLPSRTLAVDIENNFEAVYEVPKDKETVVKNLQKELNDSEDLWIATDEDREGEAIGWHLVEVLKRKKKQPVKRIAFHEITETAIRKPWRIRVSWMQALWKRSRLVVFSIGWSGTLSPLFSGRRCTGAFLPDVCSRLPSA